MLTLLTSQHKDKKIIKKSQRRRNGMILFFLQGLGNVKERFQILQIKKMIGQGDSLQQQTMQLETN